MADEMIPNLFVTPKVELTETEYKRLVSMAKMNAKKIREKAREIYEKEGVVTINFEGKIQRYRYGELQVEKYKFDCKPSEWCISPSDEFGEKLLFAIPQKERARIAKKVGNYVEEVFASNFGEHLVNLNAINKIKKHHEQNIRLFLIVSIVGWLAALAMFAVVFSK